MMSIGLGKSFVVCIFDLLGGLSQYTDKDFHSVLWTLLNPYIISTNYLIIRFVLNL